MKKLLTIIGLICLSLNLVHAQQFTKINPPTEKTLKCSCFEENGKLLVGHTSLNNDSFIFDRWNPISKKWNYSVYKVLTHEEWDEFFDNNYSCATIKDTVYLSVQRTTREFPRIYTLSDTNASLLAKLQDSGNTALDFNMKVVNQHLMVYGTFDSINHAYTGKVAYLKNKIWRNTGEPFPDNKSQLFYSFANRKDTSMFIVNQSGVKTIYSWVFPNQWTKRNFNQGFENVYSMGNTWVFSKKSSDSMFYLNVSTITGYKTNRGRGIDFRQSVETPKGFILYNENSQSIPQQMEDMAFYRYSSKQFKPFYKTNPEALVAVTENDTHCYVFSTTDILYRNVNFSNMLELRVDSTVAYGLDTIGFYLFLDKNDNNVYDVTDVLSSLSNIRNLTYNYRVSYLPANGYFTDIIPNYNDVTYGNLQYSFDVCAALKFSGNQKTLNTNSGVSKQNLLYPFKTNPDVNLSVQNMSFHQARILDTIPLLVNIKNRDCYSGSSSKASVVIQLDSGTVLVSSSPAYSSYSGHTLKFDQMTVNNLSNNTIQLKVIYPNTAYTMGQKVKHYARITSTQGEDSTDNLDSMVQKLVYSYDPNTKYSEPEGITHTDLKAIRYYIEFQNEGNNDARKVTVVDTLNLKMPIYEFQMVGSSHDYTVSLRGNVVTWVFDDINLKPKSENEEASKGYLVFDARIRTSIRVGDSILNKAQIFFDYNKPIETNKAKIRRDEPKPLVIIAGFTPTLNCRVVDFKETCKGLPDSYYWKFGDGQVSYQKQPSHRYTYNGLYNVWLLIKKYDAVRNVFVMDSMNALVEVTCNGCLKQASFVWGIDANNCKKVNLTNQTSGNISTTWLIEDAKGVNTYIYTYHASYTYKENGTYSIYMYIHYYDSLIDSHCYDTLMKQVKIDCNTSLDETGYQSPFRLELYPNPASELIMISNRGGEKQTIYIYDIRGVMIKSMEIGGNMADKIETRDWCRGLYMVTSSSGEQFRFILE